MKINKIVLVTFLFLSISLSYAQERKKLSLKDAVALVIENSNEAILANTKVETSKLELETIKNKNDWKWFCLC